MGRGVAALRLVGVGFFIGGSIALGLFIGHWFDDRWGTGLLWIVGLILGIVIAFYGVYRMLLPLMDSKKEGRNN